MKTLIKNKFHKTSMMTALGGFSTLDDLFYYASDIYLYAGDYESKKARATLSRIEKKLCPHSKKQCGCVLTA
jgi:hypothetical protein